MANRAAAFNTSAFNATMQRQFYKIKDIGTAAMTDHGKLQKVRVHTHVHRCSSDALTGSVGRQEETVKLKTQRIASKSK